MSINPFTRKRTHPDADPRAWAIPCATPPVHRTSLFSSNDSSATVLLQGKPLAPAAHSGQAPKHDDIDDSEDEDVSVHVPAPAERFVPVAALARSWQVPIQVEPTRKPASVHGAWRMPPSVAGKVATSSRSFGAINPAVSAGVAPSARSSFVDGLSLRPSQLGDTATASRAGAGGKRPAGLHTAFVTRAASEVAAAAQTLLVQHGILGPLAPTLDKVKAAMAKVRHRVLCLSYVHAHAPLVIAECEEENISAAPDADSSPREPIMVVMPRSTFERACVRGSRFVVFAPFLERTANEAHGHAMLIASYAEALPAPDPLPEADAARSSPPRYSCDVSQEAESQVL